VAVQINYGFDPDSAGFLLLEGMEPQWFIRGSSTMLHALSLKTASG
jgi:hypothetical protein